MASLDEIFGPIYGKPCWNAEAVSSSFLSFEFGEKHLWTRDSRVAAPTGSGQADPQEDSRIYGFHGDWHLWFYGCDWRLISGDMLIGDSFSERGVKRATSRLEGYKLKRVTINSDGSCVFQFDRYHRLATIPRDPGAEQWFLYEALSSHVLACYGDGRLDYRQDEHCFEEGDMRIIAALQANGPSSARTIVIKNGR